MREVAWLTAAVVVGLPVLEVVWPIVAELPQLGHP